MSTSEIEKKRMGSRIRMAREAMGLSQSELAEMIGLSIESVSRAERGTTLPTALTLLKMCDALGLDLEHLVRGGASSVLAKSHRPIVERVIRMISELDDDALRTLGDFLWSIRKVHRTTRKSDRT